MLRLLSAHGHGYRGYNEDALGVTENFLWMIDGATGVIKERLFPADLNSDACWYAHQLSNALARQVKGRGKQEPDLDEAIAQANIEVLDAANKANPDFRNIEHWKRPAASLTVGKVTSTQFIYAAIGDCTTLVKKKDGSVIILGDDRVRQFDAKTAQEMGQLREMNPNATQDELFSQLKIIEQRKIRNSEAGYWVADLSDTWMNEMVTGSIPLAEVETLMLCTDGLYRLCDTFKTHTPEQLIDQAKERGIKALINELRSLEAEDHDCKKAPRTKVSDDASGMVLDITDHHLITSVKAVITRGESDNRQVLLLRNPRDEWELPGGRVDPGETLAQTVTREIEEETGLKAHVNTHLLSDEFDVIPGRPGVEHVLIVAYDCDFDEDQKDFEVEVSVEHGAFGWIPINMLPDKQDVPDIYKRAIYEKVGKPPLFEPTKYEFLLRGIVK